MTHLDYDGRQWVLLSDLERLRARLDEADNKLHVVEHNAAEFLKLADERHAEDQARLAAAEADRDIRLAQVETHVQANVRLAARLAEAERLIAKMRRNVGWPGTHPLTLEVDAFLAGDKT